MLVRLAGVFAVGQLGSDILGAIVLDMRKQKLVANDDTVDIQQK